MKLVALVCLCLVTRCGITAAGVNGQGVVRVFAALGSDVILPCSLSTKENIQSQLFDWKKDGPSDEREVFLYDEEDKYNNGHTGQSQTFKRRVSHFPDQLKYGNASIIIRNTKVTDSGNYTCEFPRLQPRQIFRVELVVSCDLKDRTGENITGAVAAPKPYVTQLDQTKDWSRLQCEVQGASPEPHLQWQDSAGNILTAEEPQVAKSGDRYNVILRVTVTKTDRYRCVATQETICHQTPSEIYVYIVGAAPKPSVTSLKTTKDWSRLQCEVHGNPEPHLQWQDSAGNNLTAEESQVSKSGDRYNVILQVTVTKTDYYRCVATQETIKHRIAAETHVYIGGAAPKPSVTSLKTTKDWSRLQCEVHGNPEPHLQWQDSAGNNLTAEEPQVSKSGDRYNVILQVTVTKTDRYRCVATQETIKHRIAAETHVYIGESSTGWVGWTVLGIVLFVGGVLAVLVAVLRSKGCITLNWNKDEENTRNSPDANSGASIPLKSTDNN